LPRKSGGRGEDDVAVEWVAVGVVLAAGAVLVGFPFGIAVGYAWRDRISRARRVRYLIERERRRAELDSAAIAVARADPRSDVRYECGAPAGELTRQTRGAATVESNQATG
jgi:hypothetical protein